MERAADIGASKELDTEYVNPSTPLEGTRHLTTWLGYKSGFSDCRGQEKLHNELNPGAWSNGTPSNYNDFVGKLLKSTGEGSRGEGISGYWRGQCRPLGDFLSLGTTRQ